MVTRLFILLFTSALQSFTVKLLQGHPKAKALLIFYSYLYTDVYLTIKNTKLKKKICIHRLVCINLLFPGECKDSLCFV